MSKSEPILPIPSISQKTKPATTYPRNRENQYLSTPNQPSIPPTAKTTPKPITSQPNASTAHINITPLETLTDMVNKSNPNPFYPTIQKDKLAQSVLNPSIKVKIEPPSPDQIRKNAKESKGRIERKWKRSDKKREGSCDKVWKIGCKRKDEAMDVDHVDIGDGKRIKNMSDQTSVSAAEAVKQPRREF